MAIFTLEALEAKHGDCLFLHFGAPDDPKLIIIDGGPRKTAGTVFGTTIRPRLEQIADNVAGLALPLDVQLLMVSHIDDDHIGGVETLIDNAPGLVNIRALWHNSFDDFLSTNELDALAEFGNSASAAASVDRWTLGVAASVTQGRDVRIQARDQLGVIANAGTQAGFVAAGDRFAIDDLDFQILGPMKEELEGLQGKFDSENPNAASLNDDELLRALADFTDGSIANLASIVALVTHQTAQDNAPDIKKTMLLTGDARGDNIVTALENQNLLPPGGSISVDLFKVPHHGSARNVTTDFFRTVKARHYLFSANGRDENPDKETLEMLTEAREDEVYSMHFTNRLDRIEEFFNEDRANHSRNYDFHFRADDELSIAVDLDDPLTF